MNQVQLTDFFRDFMPSADPDANQGPKDISFSIVLRSTNWAIGGCLYVIRFDLLSGDCLIFFHLKTLTTTWRKQEFFMIQWEKLFFIALYNNIVNLMAKIWLHVQNYLLHFFPLFHFWKVKQFPAIIIKQ